MIFNEVYEKILNIKPEALSMSLRDVHVKGLFSLVIDGEYFEETGKLKHGTLTRVFIATKKIKPFDIQFHSHCYDLRIGVIDGVFEHHIAIENFSEDFHNDNSVKLKTFEYKSPLNGGNGLIETEVSVYGLNSFICPVGSELFLPSDQIHSVSCDKGTVWIVHELGFNTDSSVVLGTSFQTDGLYKEPKQYQTNNMYEKVLDKLKRLV